MQLLKHQLLSNGKMIFLKTKVLKLQNYKIVYKLKILIKVFIYVKF